MSHPTWVRGLKRDKFPFDFPKLLSHPTWVRGLKQRKKSDFLNTFWVAPYVGAWIETRACVRK